MFIPVRLVLGFVATLTLPIVAIAGNAETPKAKDSPPNIAIKLMVEKNVIHPGETLKLKVEIWNVGTDDIFIAQNIDATSGNSDLELLLEVGSVLWGSNEHVIGDRIPDSDPDLATTFVTNWLTLNKAHYYGTYVYMDPDDFPQLRVPGHYRVRAEYSSRGISSVPGWNGAYLKQEDIDKLPFKAWKGTTDSNFVRIQVNPRTKRTTEK